MVYTQMLMTSEYAESNVTEVLGRIFGTNRVEVMEERKKKYIAKNLPLHTIIFV